MNTIIQTYQLTKTFNKEEVIKPLDFSLRKGEICALIGKNGAGKSTFFKLLAGQLMPTSGDIYLFGKSGREMEQTKKRMGFMIETPAFFLILLQPKTWSTFEFSGVWLKRNAFMRCCKLLA